MEEGQDRNYDATPRASAGWPHILGGVALQDSEAHTDGLSLQPHCQGATSSQKGGEEVVVGRVDNMRGKECAISERGSKKTWRRVWVKQSL